jgi:hypothetical protein
MNTYRDDIYLAANGVLISYQGSDKKVEIPSRLSDRKITTIGKGACMSDDMMQEVIIPDTVESIEERAFFGNMRLEKVTMNKPVRKVGRNAFIGCNQIDIIKVKSYEMDVSDYKYLKNNSIKTTSNTYLARYMPDRYIPEGLLESLQYKPAVYIPEDIDYLYHTYNSKISATNIPKMLAYSNTTIAYGLEFKEGTSKLKEVQDFINNKDKVETPSNIIPKAEEKNDWYVRSDEDLSQFVKKVLIFVLDDNETVVKGDKCRITYNIQCGYYFWQNAQKVVLKGKKYYIYVRKYLSSDLDIPYVKQDIAVFYNDTYVTDELEVQEVYAKYKLLSIL